MANTSKDLRIGYAAPRKDYEDVVDAEAYAQRRCIQVNHMLGAQNRGKREAAKLGADGVKNAHNRAAARLRYYQREGREALTLAEWDKLAEDAGIREVPGLWVAHLNGGIAED